MIWKHTQMDRQPYSKALRTIALILEQSSSDEEAVRQIREFLEWSGISVQGQREALLRELNEESTE